MVKDRTVIRSTFLWSGTFAYFPEPQRWVVKHRYERDCDSIMFGKIFREHRDLVIGVKAEEYLVTLKQGTGEIADPLSLQHTLLDRGLVKCGNGDTPESLQVGV